MEEISLDAVESDRDEAPDYRPLLKSSDPGGPVSPRIEYRMRYLSTLESEESSRYKEFARIAEGEGFRKVAKVFREILHEEEGHVSALSGGKSTISNLGASIDREKTKIETIRSIKEAAGESGNEELVKKLENMISEEERHVRKLENVLSDVETDMKKMEEKERARREKEKDKEDAKVCSMGVCAKEGEEADEVCTGGGCFTED